MNDSKTEELIIIMLNNLEKKVDRLVESAEGAEVKCSAHREKMDTRIRGAETIITSHSVQLKLIGIVSVAAFTAALSALVNLIKGVKI